MPYTPTTPTLTLCDNLITALLAAWLPQAPDNAQRAYLHRIDLKSVQGRQVLIFPTGYTNAPASRGHDFYTHNITALVFRRYTAAADSEVVVPAEWVDEEVDFVHTRIVQGFDYGRTLATFNRNLVTLSADVTELYDGEKLATQKEFWCAVEMVFQEQRTA